MTLYMANLENNGIAFEEVTTTSAEPSMAPREGAEETLVLGSEVQSMSVASDVRQLFSTVTGVVRQGTQLIMAWQQLDRAINGGRARPNDARLQQYENARAGQYETQFANAVYGVARQLETDAFLSQSDLEQQTWATKNSLALERLYLQMPVSSQDAFKDEYNTVQEELAKFDADTYMASAQSQNYVYPDNNSTLASSHDMGNNYVAPPATPYEKSLKL